MKDVVRESIHDILIGFIQDTERIEEDYEKERELAKILLTIFH